MSTVGDTITIAAFQASPVFLDRQATIEKAARARGRLFDLRVHRRQTPFVRFVDVDAEPRRDTLPD